MNEEKIPNKQHLVVSWLVQGVVLNLTQIPFTVQVERARPAKL